MSQYTTITSGENLTSFVFYNEILPQLHNHFLENYNNKIIFDFSNVDRINPLVIPNFLNVGQIIKNYYNTPPDLFIPWKPKLLKYLDDIRFLDLVREHNIFKLDERFIGGYPLERKLSKICYAFYLPFGTDKNEIFSKHLNNDKINFVRGTKKKSYNYYQIIRKLFNEKQTLDILSIITELCHNACNHSLNKCFACFQVNQKSKFEFSVSDCGIGYHKSFQKKMNTGKKLRILNKNTSNLSRNEYNINAILEAVFYRYNNPKQGIFDIFKLILPIGGIVRIHTDNTQLIFTKTNFEKYLNFSDDSKFDKNIVDKIIKDFKGKEQSFFNKIYSPLRIYDYKFNGVHIEIEIPFNKKDTND